ncbi:hypothetical protein [Nocardia flavorosea]|uniref:Uncharacterized protein n=1 Tax=Nocardia flavorosea TaxID=53429 RepID=A0A846YDX2_9NOCA|nr:hypothetical protein [Nocardia flavorosea]NKY57223.1 hypothetical protein [Nocardia flavorosea]
MTKQWFNPDEWREQRYQPSEMSQRYFRDQYRMHAEMRLAQLNALFVNGDELAFAKSAQSFADYVARLDAQLRESLTGGPALDESESARAAPVRRVRRVS